MFKLSFKATESLLFRARQSFKLAYERAWIYSETARTGKRAGKTY
jgi:hypothetical protein